MFRTPPVSACVFLCVALVVGIGCDSSPSSTPPGSEQPGAAATPATLATSQTQPSTGPQTPPSGSLTPGSTVNGSLAPSSTWPPITDVNDAGALTIAAPDSPDFAILADGYLFTTDVNGGMEVYDQDGKVQPKPNLGGACAAPDAGFGAVWTATCDLTSGLIRVDTASFGAAPVDIGGQIPTSEATIGVGEGGVWMIRDTRQRELIKVDPQVQSRKVVFEEPAPPGAVSVRVGFGSVWVSSPESNTITRVDPASGTTLASITVGERPQFFVAGEGAIWTLDQIGGSVSRIDPDTNAVSATIQLGETVEGGDIAAGGGFVWARSSATLLFKIDPLTNQIVARYGPPSGSGSVAADDQYTWITAHDINTIWRLPAS
jgi:virginiamycin B lyase